jgi:hypothetical protein
MNDPDRGVAVLYSGGTDSTASAALLAERFDEVHLLTFDRHGFHDAGNSGRNVALLAARFPDTRFVHRVLETSALGAWISEHKRWKHLREHGFMTLQACGHCALANHLAGLAWCQRHGLGHLADGITHDWPFFPGHMDSVIERLRALHASFGVRYLTPVLHCEIDKPLRYIDKLTGAVAPEPPPEADTTGRILQRLGLSQRANYKGTDQDRKSQAHCRQFMLPNLYIYWYYLPRKSWGDYEQAVLAYFEALIAQATEAMRAHLERGEHAELFAFLDQAEPITGQGALDDGGQA